MGRVVKLNNNPETEEKVVDSGKVFYYLIQHLDFYISYEFYLWIEDIIAPLYNDTGYFDTRIIFSEVLRSLPEDSFTYSREKVIRILQVIEKGYFEGEFWEG